MADDAEYHPVACGFYDELGLRMLRGQTCRLVIAELDKRETIETQIDDLYSADGAEYVRLAHGRTVRLDHIVQVDGVKRTSS